MNSPAISRAGSGGWPGPRRADRGEAPLEEPPVDLARQPDQRVAHVDDLLQRRPEQVLLPLVARLRHRVPPSNLRSIRESRSDQNRNPKLQESRAQTRLSCKIDYSLERTCLSPAGLSEFFTGDYIAEIAADERSSLFPFPASGMTRPTRQTNPIRPKHACRRAA